VLNCRPSCVRWTTGRDVVSEWEEEPSEISCCCGQWWFTLNDLVDYNSSPSHFSSVRSFSRYNIIVHCLHRSYWQCDCFNVILACDRHTRGQTDTQWHWHLGHTCIIQDTLRVCRAVNIYPCVSNKAYVSSIT